MKYRISAVVLISLGVLAACQTKKSGNIAKENITDVKIFPVKAVSYSLPVRASGMLTTRKEMKLALKTGGIISSIPVHEGEMVEKDQLLAKLDLSEIKAQQQQAAVAVEKAERDLTRAGNLYRDTVGTLEKFQNAQSAYDVALSRKKIADYNYLHSFIKAPDAGRVLKILMETNEIAAPGYPVILFAPAGNNWVVRVPITDKDIVRLSEEDSASIVMDAFPGIIFSARVTVLGVIADPFTGTYEAELQPDIINPEFRTGYIARAEMFPAETKTGYWVPMEAVLDATDNTGYIYVLDGTSPVKRRVTTGALIKEGILILDGLAGGEIVITEGAKYLGADPKINIVNLPKAGVK